MKPLIGTSLSFCILEIIQGKVNPDEVTKIITSVESRSDADWAQTNHIYRDSYWRENPDRGTELLERFRREGKIGQTRRNYRRSPGQVWVQDESEILWENQHA